MRKVKTGGGWPAVWYTLRKGREVGGLWKLWKAMRSKNACKTCAVGMGGQAGGMVNEQGHFPEVCKKSLQAMAADMQGAIRPDFWSTYAVAQLQAFTPRELETCGRITAPVLLRRGEDYYQPIDWDEALSRIVEKLRGTTPDDTFWYFSGRASNEAAFLLQLFARLYGTNNVNNCSYYCHQASGVGLASSVGTGTATIGLADLDGADLVFVIGGNPASNHPRLMRTLMQVRRRGGEVIVINPVVETGLVNFSVPSDVRSLLFGSEIASLYVQPHIGGDLALLAGIAKRVDEMQAIDAEYLNHCCEGWSEFSLWLRTLDWSEICHKSGVAREEIDAIALRYAKANHVVFSWTMGITHHLHGVQNVQAIANLAMLRGMVGRPGSGLLPIRGHSNVQGIGSVGVTPKLKQALFDRIEAYFNVKLPTGPGLDTLECLERADGGRLKMGFCLGGNLYGASPDATYASRALGKLDLLVYLNTTLNTGHAHGLAEETLILPVLARDEEPQPTTQESMFNFVRLSDGGPARHEGPRGEVEIVAGLAGQVLKGGTAVDWSSMRDTSRIRAAIAAVVPGFEKIAQIGRTKEEFSIEGRVLHEPRFPTASGRAKLHTHVLPDLPRDGASLRLMTVRSEGQFNTVVYEDYDLYRGQDRRDVILLHPSDVERLGLEENQRVTVRSEAGCLPGILVKAFADIKPGNALMYYPEANVLVPRHADPLSKTPAFKSTVVTLEASGIVELAPTTRDSAATTHVARKPLPSC
ncbi:MAG TPA: FdhF/YdeP family oxidoreductase [Pirellulales bacterium]|jgi:molybdopterin-dependent oxidoreductase alpha subunit|nr:FdhF/YdeP family oxidoreductase [Pirellulales bacterium]